AASYFPQALQDYALHVLQYRWPSTQAIDWATVFRQSTRLHIQAIKKLLRTLNYTAPDIDLIGYHGQTLFHKPAAKITVQVGDAEWMANHLKIPVVCDFRSQDILAGGQGAPLAPLYHQALVVGDQCYPAAIVNCGGIANVTLITGKTI